MLPYLPIRTRGMRLCIPTPLSDWLSLKFRRYESETLCKFSKHKTCWWGRLGLELGLPLLRSKVSCITNECGWPPCLLLLESVVWQLRNWAKGLLLHQTECCRCTKCASAKQLTDCFSHLVSSRVTEGCTESVFWLQCFRSGTMSCMRQCHEELPHGGQRLDVLKNF